MITAGALPFDEPNLGSLFHKISKAEYHTPAWFSEELAHLLHAIITPDPKARSVCLMSAEGSPVGLRDASHRCIMSHCPAACCRPTIEQLRQHPWVKQDYVMAQPRDPVPKVGTDNDLFAPTVNPRNLSSVRSGGALTAKCLEAAHVCTTRPGLADCCLCAPRQDESRKAVMRRRRTNTAGEERWFLAPTSHMNAFQVRHVNHLLFRSLM